MNLYNVFYCARRRGSIGKTETVQVRVHAGGKLAARYTAFHKLQANDWETFHCERVELIEDSPQVDTNNGR